ncbi:MAG: UDP-N-acetylmuramoyl-L-alanyl-D-glutamate--2,6-diaminopimelate ligase [Aestuariivita sp.]|nr:UDP-N-acetylmuramoyl-L-alanyl-D-glutamate--2,6-diaminopimelate ligase [Aestuariivita sp.]
MGPSVRLLNELGLTDQRGHNPPITGLTADSRSVRKGHVFVALPGTRVHGAHYVKQALRNGAVAILSDAAGLEIAHAILAQTDVSCILEENPRQALAFAAARWYGGQPETMVAVTGTNGKTSVAHFVRQLWSNFGHSAVSIGTTGVEGVWTAPLSHTSPDPVILHHILNEAVAQDVTHVAMEASSHGLAQHRLDGVRIQAAAFTNLSQDHLDYHASMDAYFEAKLGLFRRVLPRCGAAVLNVDDPKVRDVSLISESLGQDVVTVGRDCDADVCLLSQRLDARGQDMHFAFRGKQHLVRLNLIGGFQAENALLAFGLLVVTGEDPDEVIACLPRLTTVRGRMQWVATRQNKGTVYVDFAHTPHALVTALTALRQHVMGRLIVITGAGGDRDTSKRPLMGAAAAGYSDLVIVTDDNPRHEDAARIRSDVKNGAPNAIEIADRAEAILRGVDMLQSGDSLLIAGKGHETVQIVGNSQFPFDDAEQASMAVTLLDGGRA